MIGLESNMISIDIHESKAPVNLLPDFVEVYHDGKLVHEFSDTPDMGSGVLENVF